MTEQTPTLLDRTVRRFRSAWRFAGKTRYSLKDAVAPDLPEEDAIRLRAQIDACLEARGGEVSARARAADLGEAYLVLDATGRERFMTILAREYDVDRDALDTAVSDWREASDESARRAMESTLRSVLVAPRTRLLSQFNGLNQGVKFLVDFRSELMRLAPGSPELAALDADLRELLASWFDVGFLDLKRITWNTSAALLEKLIEYEAVHAIRSWVDLKNRLAADRRCYAYFHPRMPDEPLIFVQVALVKGIAGNVQVLLDEEQPPGEPEKADTAIFYSISNCQQGLSGVSFGNFLIKRVVGDLSRDMPNLKTFATLSPIPGFRAWLRRHEDLLTEAEESGWRSALPEDEQPECLNAVLETEDWTRNENLTAALEPILMRLCAHFLLKERGVGGTLDRVAHFHLSNGARVERINWLANLSTQGLERSAGMMVNYLYKLDDIEKNHEAYTGDGKVTAAPAVRKLLKTAS